MKKLMAILLSLTLACAAVLPALAEGKKDETVYVLANPDGSARRVIVSDYLSNPDGADTIADVSNLEKIQNVKGDEAFADGVWQAKGNEIYYQGDSSEALPVELKISATLDGTEIAPADLAGRSGHVTLRFDYAVSASYTKDAETVAVPFAVITGALLDNEVFANVSVKNGQAVNDGDRTVAVGLCVPGLTAGLKLESDKVELPEYLEISADVKNFSLPVTVTLATNEAFATLDADKLQDADALKEAADKLTDAMTQLLDGSNQLYNGLNDLKDGTTNLNNGINQLADGTVSLAAGADTLSTGLTTLTANNETLVGGARQVFETLLAQANAALIQAGVDATLTVENYADVLGKLVEAVSEEGVTAQARAQVEAAVRAQADAVRSEVTKAVRPQVEAQVTEAVKENVMAQILATQNLTMETYEAAQKAGLVTDAQRQQLEGALNQQMQTAQVQQAIVADLIEQNTEEQIGLLVDQNMQSETVQAQIAAACEQGAPLVTLKAQLDSYNTFYTGLIAYTNGASDAASGAAQLKAGADTLQSGAAQLKDAMPALTDGVNKLVDGAKALADGLITFDADGVSKLTSAINEDLDPLLARAQLLIEAAQSYNNYSGLAEGMDGAVRFIYRTDAIE